MSKLALFGGQPIRTKPFPAHPVIGDEEKAAVMEVLNSGKLSTFIASPGKHFLGGEKIREFENLFKTYHKTKYAIVFNSATAALHAAIVAVGVQPGEEVIVPPYTFTSTATCALMHNAIPVFVDVDKNSFCLNPALLENKKSPLTKAIIPVHLFGTTADMDSIMVFANKYGYKVIEDCAQAPGVKYKDKLVGTIGHCGIFSFTESKTITTGEGGMLITNDDEIAKIARLIRNHGEAIESHTRSYNSATLGWNYRMTEIAAAIGIEQFKKLDKINNHRIKLASFLNTELSKIKGIKIPETIDNCTHTYWFYALKFNQAKFNIHRNIFVKALIAEGIPFGSGYIKPLYLAPLYHENQPFAYKNYTGNTSYEKGICPVTEKLYEDELLNTIIVRPPATINDMCDIVDAFHKIIENIEELK